MSEYILTENLHLGITPGGTYYAVQDNAEEPGRLFCTGCCKSLSPPCSRWMSLVN